MRVIDGRPVEPIPGPMDVLREVPGGSLDVRAVADHVRNDPTTLHVALEVRLSQEGQLFSARFVDAEGREDRVPSCRPVLEVRDRLPLPSIHLGPLLHEGLKMRDAGVAEYPEAPEGRIAPSIHRRLSAKRKGMRCIRRARGTRNSWARGTRNS